jgi:hypothetical protein
MIAASIYLLVLAHQVRTRHGALTVLEPYKVGEDLTDVAPLRPLATERLLVMWIQSTCRYCGESKVSSVWTGVLHPDEEGRLATAIGRQAVSRR